MLVDAGSLRAFNRRDWPHGRSPVRPRVGTLAAESPIRRLVLHGLLTFDAISLNYLVHFCGLLGGAIRVEDEFVDEPGLPNHDALLVDNVVELAFLLENFIFIVLFVLVIFHVLVVICIETPLFLLVQVVLRIKLL